MKNVLIGATVLSLLTGVSVANAQTETNGLILAQAKKSDPNMLPPSDPRSQRQGTSARPDEDGGTSNSGNVGSGGSSGGTTGSAGGNASGTAGAAGDAAAGAGGSTGDAAGGAAK